MIEDLGTTGRSSRGSPSPLPDQYEHIFSVHKDDGYYMYNILQQVVLPEELDTGFYEIVSPPPSMPYSILSYRIYGTMNLWWLICVANGIDNPTQLTKAGDSLKIIKPQFVGRVLSLIHSQITK